MENYYPRSAEDMPFLDADVLSKFLDVLDQVPRCIFLQGRGPARGPRYINRRILRTDLDLKLTESTSHCLFDQKAQSIFFFAMRSIEQVEEVTEKRLEAHQTSDMIEIGVDLLCTWSG